MPEGQAAPPGLTSEARIVACLPDFISAQIGSASGEIVVDIWPPLSRIYGSRPRPQLEIEI